MKYGEIGYKLEKDNNFLTCGTAIARANRGQKARTGKRQMVMHRKRKQSKAQKKELPKSRRGPYAVDDEQVF